MWRTLWFSLGKGLHTLCAWAHTAQYDSGPTADSAGASQRLLGPATFSGVLAPSPAVALPQIQGRSLFFSFRRNWFVHLHKHQWEDHA